jgi:predicted AlkP superfamily phosphohydrolase/phosphomutase
MRIFFYHLQNYHEGVLAAVFDSLDRIQHMFWRKRRDIIEDWYVRLDDLFGQTINGIGSDSSEETSVIVLSDHGFGDYDYKVHLNRWLIDRGYMSVKKNLDRGSWGDVDWSKTRAYAIGLNSLYLNLKGRERKGTVTSSEREALITQIGDQLSTWRGLDGRFVVQKSQRREAKTSDVLFYQGPDVIVGYSPGYRASPQTGLGGWESESLEPNRDHWSGDHCFDAESVPGVIFSNRRLSDFHRVSYRDVPSMTVNASPDSSWAAPSPSFSEEEMEIIEDRLRGLGYF